MTKFVQHNDSWPRLTPRITGIVMDMEHFESGYKVDYDKLNIEQNIENIANTLKK
jgi:hypothetical protein